MGLGRSDIQVDQPDQLHLGAVGDRPQPGLAHIADPDQHHLQRLPVIRDGSEIH